MIPARLVLTLLGFLGNICLYAMRVNLSVAMVAMVGRPSPSNETNSTVDTCPELITDDVSIDNDTVTVGEFGWNSDLQAQVVGSIFYGYLFTQIPGGVLAEKYGAKWIFGIGILINSLFTLLTPVAARWSVWALVAVRVIEGLASGVAFPAMNVLISKWVPRMERSRLSTIMMMGALLGTLITNVVTGLLCDSSFLGGWPSIFYICGTLGCVWFVSWAVLIYESPEIHPRISKKELAYIQGGIDQVVVENVKIPWKSIWTSMPVWAVIIAHVGQNWAFYTLLTMMPTYLANILHFDLKNNGIVSGLPYLMMALFAFPSSMLADGLRASGRLKVTTIRKLFNSVAFFGAGLCAVAIAFTGCHPIAIIVLFSISFGLNSFIYSGFMVNHVDMSPRFAGTLFGITNAFATFPGFLAPSFVGLILSGGQTLRNWGLVFITTAAIHFVTGIFYIVFASAELQPWNDSTEDEAVKKEPAPPYPEDEFYNSKL